MPTHKSRPAYLDGDRPACNLCRQVKKRGDVSRGPAAVGARHAVPALALLTLPAAVDAQTLAHRPRGLWLVPTSDAGYGGPARKKQSALGAPLQPCSAHRACNAVL